MPTLGPSSWAKGFCKSCAYKKGHEGPQTATKISHHKKKEIVDSKPKEIVKKAERSSCVEGNIQVKLGTAPKINYIRECTGTS